MARFNGVASKYLDCYLAWFGFAVNKGAVAMNVKMKDMIIEACVKGLVCSDFRAASCFKHRASPPAKGARTVPRFIAPLNIPIASPMP